MGLFRTLVEHQYVSSATAISMSVLGQKLPRDLAGGAAALPPKAAAALAERRVR